MAEIGHVENRHDVIFSAEGGPIWIKFRTLVHNDMSTALIWPKSKPEVEFQYGGRLGEFNGMSPQSHLPHCRVLPPSEFNVMMLTCHTVGCCYRPNSLSWFQSHMPQCRVLPPGEFNNMSSQSHVSRCRVQSPGEVNGMIPVLYCRV